MNDDYDGYDGPGLCSVILAMWLAIISVLLCVTWFSLSRIAEMLQ